MLFFLPEKAYGIIKEYAETEKPAAPTKPKYYFMKQIKDIAHDENQMVTELKINLAKKDAELIDTKAELIDTKAELAKVLIENADLKKKNADLETALLDSRDKINDDIEKEGR